MNQKLGAYIRSERLRTTKYQPVSMREFAKEVGVSASYMSDIELDRRRVSKAMILKIARAFAVLVAGDRYKRYNIMLTKARLMTPERQCLLDITSASKIGGIIDLHSDTKQQIYEALYGELNEIILYGVKEG